MINIETISGGITVLRVSEARLDAANARVFKQTVSEVIEGGQVRIVLDLRDVSFVDSSGLGALIGILKLIGVRGDLTLCGLCAPVKRTLHLTRMDRVFLIFKDVPTALHHLTA